MNSKAPVLFIIFYRPDLTARVFEAIKSYKPTELFISADGPRNEQDEKWCEETRKVVEEVDWECTVHRLYRNKNLGCKTAVTEAISWFFSQVEEGIILEDDCLPHPDFFEFCNNMLIRYRDASHIGLISGTSFYQIPVNDNYNHYLSPIAHIWGWASWKRVWKNYDVDPVSSPHFNWRKMPGNTLVNKLFWFVKLAKIHLGDIDTWDYQVQHMISVHDQKTVIPQVNLIKNIGFDERATHTTNQSAGMETRSLSSYTPECIPEIETSKIIRNAIDTATKKNTLKLLIEFVICNVKLLWR
jgi:hypothetical protein